MGKYSIYIVLGLFLISLLFLLEDSKKEIVVDEVKHIKPKKDENTSKVEIAFYKEDADENRNLLKVKPVKDNQDIFIISKTSSRNKVFEIMLYSYENLDYTYDNFVIGGSISFEEISDIYSLKFNKELLKYTDKLYVEITYNNKTFKTNAFRLAEIKEEYIYAVDMFLEDDCINIDPYDIQQRVKITQKLIKSSDINLTNRLNQIKIIDKNMQKLIDAKSLKTPIY